MTGNEGHHDAFPLILRHRFLRYHHVEKWRAGTIARQLSVHYDSGVRVYCRGGSRNGAALRRSQIEPYLAIHRETLRGSQR